MIKSLKIKNFKKFTDASWEFQSGLNVVRGKNEAGKSSLLTAINTALYVDVHTKSKTFLNNVRSWGQARPAPEILLQFSNGDTLLRDFQNRKQLLSKNSNVNGQQQIEKTEDFQQIQKYLFENHAIPHEQLFANTAFIRQAEITQIEFNQDVKNAIQNVISLQSSRNNISQKIKTYKSELSNLELGLKRPSKFPGPIKAAQEKITELELKLKDLQTKFKDSQQEKTQNKESVGKLEEADKKIVELEKTLENHKKLEEAKKRLKLVDQQLNDINSLMNQMAQEQVGLDQVNFALKAFARMATGTLEEDSKKLIELKQQVSILKETAESISASLVKQTKALKIDYGKKEREARKINLIAGTGVVSLAIAGILSVAGQITELSLFTAVGGLLFLISAGILGYAAVKKLVPVDDSRSEEEESDLTSSINKNLVATQQKIQAAQERQKEVLSRYGLQDSTEFFTQKAKYVTLMDEKSRVESKIKGHLNNKSIGDVKAEQNQLYSQKQEIENLELTPEVKAADLSPNDYLRIRRELDMLTIEKKRLERDSVASETKAQVISVSKNDIITLEEELDFWRSKLATASARAQALVFAIDLVEGALKKTSQTLNTHIKEFADPKVKEITMGGYSEVMISPEYDILVKPQNLGEMINPLDVLSAGTVDQIYFVLRLGLAKMLLKQGFKYLFLDDPFVSFDDERLEKTRALLLDLVKAEGLQIMLFTHNSRYDDWGNLITI